MSLTKKESHWIPLADLMTVLMVLFLFMSISFMALVQKRQKEQNKLFKDYEESKISLYNELDSTFRKDFERWSLKLDKDLSIKFTNPQVLFSSGSAEITPYFQSVLSEFLPKYLNVVLQEKYKTKIAEIRIEGHTDTKPINKTDDPYIDNMQLSQNRARNVLAFLRSQDFFINLGDKTKSRLQYWLTANGLSYGRTVDKNYNLTFYNNQVIDDDKSRRVEFRIVTTSEEIINEALKNIEGK
ncbi:MAG: OmpA family protein [Crocinitomicaceae bacterium]|nr:OmpA family protein [Crocinitomicaceae bacterium]